MLVEGEWFRGFLQVLSEQFELKIFPFLKYLKINQTPSCAVHSPFDSLTLI